MTALSITTAVPVGPLVDGCINQLYNLDLPRGFNTCANASLGYSDADYESICCDGDIIDSTQDWFRASKAWDPADLICCRTLAPELGGIAPINTDYRHCTGGTATPLLSLAATNTANAQIYPVTYLSASGPGPDYGDFTWTKTPYCLWALTAGASVSTTEVTVVAADITTLPLGWPNSDDPLITPEATPYSSDNTPHTASSTRTQSSMQSSQTSIDDSLTASTVPTSTAVSAPSATATATSDSMPSITITRLWLFTIILTAGPLGV